MPNCACVVQVTTLLSDSDSIRYVANISRKLLKAACKELGRFAEASKKLAVENQETLHLVIPMLHELKAKMQKQKIQYKNESPEMSQLCRDLAKSVDEKCWAKLTWYHFAAAYLYPVYREHDSLKLSSMKREIDRVRLDMKGILTTMEDKSVEAATAPPTKKLKTVLFSDSDDEFRSKTEDVTRFPKLAVIDRSVYSIPASQNKSERAFGAAGDLMTDLRSTLKPKHLDEVLLVRSFNKLKRAMD